MTQLEQLKVIVEKEMKTKEWLSKHESNTANSSAYWKGGLSALTYVKHVIERLIKEEDGK